MMTSRDGAFGIVMAVAAGTLFLVPAHGSAQEIRPEDVAAIQVGPVFTPMTVRPEILNRTYVQSALMRLYPPDLRDAGIGGSAVVWFYISDAGRVLHSEIDESSGHEGLDQAALKVATVFRFTPAEYRTEPVAVWIHLPITFAVQ